MKKITIENAKYHFFSDKARVFIINGLFYWIPNSLMLEWNQNEDKVTVPEWFYKKMKPDLNYIY